MKPASTSCDRTDSHALTIVRMLLDAKLIKLRYWLHDSLEIETDSVGHAALCWGRYYLALEEDFLRSHILHKDSLLHWWKQGIMDETWEQLRKRRGIVRPL